LSEEEVLQSLYLSLLLKKGNKDNFVKNVK
jgi:hypothetical protein